MRDSGDERQPSCSVMALQSHCTQAELPLLRLLVERGELTRGCLSHFEWVSARWKPMMTSELLKCLTCEG